MANGDQPLKRRKRKTPGKSPAVVIILTLITALMAGMWWYASITVKAVEAQTYTALMDSAADRRTAIKAKLDGFFMALEGCAAHLSGSAIPGDREHMMKTMSDFTLINAFYYVGLADGDGLALINNGRIIPTGKADYYMNSMLGQRSVARVKQSQLLNEPHIILSVPVWAGGRVSGVALGVLKLDTLSQMINENNEDGVFTFVCDSKGEVMIGSSDKNSFITGDKNVFQVITDRQPRSGEKLAEESTDLSGHNNLTLYGKCPTGNCYATFVQLGMNDWYIVNVAPSSLVDAGSRVLYGRTAPPMVLILGVFLLLILFTFIFERSLARRRAQTHEQLRRSEEMYRCVEEMSDNVLFEGDPLANTVHFNKKFRQLFGGEPNISRFSGFGEFPNPYIYEEDRQIWQAFGLAMHRGHSNSQVELRFRHRDGQLIWCRLEYVYLRDNKGVPYRMVGKISNIDAQKRMLSKLQDEAQSDSLTGLLNHASFLAQSEQYLQGPGAGGRHGLLILDVDDFKRVNDTLGHYLGDQALQQVAGRLRQVFRATDLLCRLGGDEFAVLIKDVGGQPALEHKAGQLVEGTRCVLKDGGQELDLSISVGAALSIGNGGILDLYRRADQALYQAKSRGKNRYALDGE